MESETPAEIQPDDVDNNAAGVHDTQTMPSESGAVSPTSRSTSEASPQTQEVEQQVNSAALLVQSAAAETPDVSEAAPTPENLAPAHSDSSQPTEQGVEASSSEVLAVPLTQTANAASDVQPDQQEVQRQATEPATETAQGSSADTEARTDETAGLSSLAAQPPSAAVQPAHADSTPSGQEQESEVAPYAHATFVVPTENWKHLQIVPLATTAAEIKHSLCSNWNIAETALSVRYNRHVLKDDQSLASCGIQV